jgi:hypothetical protein
MRLQSFGGSAGLRLDEKLKASPFIPEVFCQAKEIWSNTGANPYLAEGASMCKKT